MCGFVCVCVCVCVCVKGLDMHAKVPYTSSLYMNTMSLCYNHSVNYKKKNSLERGFPILPLADIVFIQISYITNFILINIFEIFL